MNLTILKFHPWSRNLSWKVAVKHLCQRQPVPASNWIHLSLALFLFWFCDFSALYRNGIFWHLNKEYLSPKFNLFVSRILYYFLSPPPSKVFFLFSKEWPSEIMRTEVIGSRILFLNPRLLGSYFSLAHFFLSCLSDLLGLCFVLLRVFKFVFKKTWVLGHHREERKEWVAHCCIWEGGLASHGFESRRWN